MDNDLLNRAIVFATEAHAGQKRKNGTPFILHPLEDAAIVGSMTTDVEVIAAAVLHDTVEDTDVSPEQIRALFGERVYSLVMHETENSYSGIPRDQSWKKRKQESLSALETSDDIAVKMLWLGDKLSNIRGLYSMFMQKGIVDFSSFNNRDPLAQKWYYSRILALLQDLHKFPAYDEYRSFYHRIFDRFEGEIKDEY